MNHVEVSPLTPEIYCSNIKTSLAFYTGVLGFEMLYQREAEGFAMLERQGARIMLEESKKGAIDNDRVWLSAPLERPFGRGVNFQIHTTQVAALYEKVQLNDADIFLPMEEKWYRVGDFELCHWQFIILDPDGYMLRFVELIGEPKIVV